MNIGDILGAAALFVSIVAIPIAYLLARRGRQVPNLRYRIDFKVLLDPTDRLFDLGLKMELSGQPLTCISRTRVAFWNKRGDTVRGSEIVDDDPLRIQLAEGDIVLQSRSISVSRKVTRMIANIDLSDQSSVRLSFDFLDAGDGGIFEVIHRTISEPSVLGTVRGATIQRAGEAVLDDEALKAVASSPLHRSGFYRFLPRLVPKSIIQHQSWPDTDLDRPPAVDKPDSVIEAGGPDS